MTSLTPYIHFPGSAREALLYYQDVFGGTVTLHTNGEMGRRDGDPDAIGHGFLDGPVALFGADADDRNGPFSAEGLMFALLGTTDSSVMTDWFSRLAKDGSIVDELDLRPWGDTDGQVRDKYGVVWLIGFAPGE